MVHLPQTWKPACGNCDERVHPARLAFWLPLSSSPDAVEGLILLLILLKVLLVCNYRSQVMNAPSKIRGSTSSQVEKMDNWVYWIAWI